MPEIWLGYGSTYVVLDIKQENLLHVTSEMNLMSEEHIRNILTDIELSNKTLLFPLSSSKHLLKIISILIDVSKADNNIEIEIGTFSNDFLPIKNRFVNNKVIQIDRHNFHEKINKFDNVIFISKIGYDPLFGFNGTPSIIARNYVNDLMNDIFNANEIIRPCPGQIDEPLKMALEYYDKLSVHSIEILSGHYGISRIYYGNNSQFFKEAFSDFKSNTISHIEEQKSLIISSGSELDNHLTLNNSLYSLWNSISVLKKQGTVVLLAENSHGLGKGALTMYVEGKLNLFEIKRNTRYINGLEHLIYIKNLKDEYDLGLVSSLPFYYTKTKLGLNTYNNVKEVLENLIARYGKTSKVMISLDPSISLFIKK